MLVTLQQHLSGSPECRLISFHKNREIRKTREREREDAKTDSDKPAQSTKAVELINTRFYPLVTTRWP